MHPTAPLPHPTAYTTPPAADAMRPWAIAEAHESQSSRKSTTFRLPLELHLQLKWLGETTYGESMTDIVITALEKEVALRLRDRGVVPPPVSKT